jgi:hypothetical protein
LRACLIVVVAAAFTVGCVDYEETLSLNPDGSGTVEVHYWTGAENVAGDDELSMLPERFVFDAARAEKIWAGPGVRLDVFSVDTETIVTDTTVHAHLSISFDHVRNLSSPVRGFSDREATFDTEDGLTLTMIVGRGKGGDVDTSVASDVFTFIVEMPGEIEETNGRLLTDSSAIWTFSEGEMEQLKTTMTTRVAPQTEFPILAVGVAVIVVVVIVWVVAFSRRRSVSGDVG